MNAIQKLLFQQREIIAGGKEAIAMTKNSLSECLLIVPRLMLADHILRLLKDAEEDDWRLEKTAADLRSALLLWTPPRTTSRMADAAEEARYLALRRCSYTVSQVLRDQSIYDCTLSFTSRTLGFEKVDAAMIQRDTIVYLWAPAGRLEKDFAFRQKFPSISRARAFCSSFRNGNICTGPDGFSPIVPVGETHADRVARSRRS